jgi:hypothetical protein
MKDTKDDQAEDEKTNLKWQMTLKSVTPALEACSVMRPVVEPCEAEFRVFPTLELPVQHTDGMLHVSKNNPGGGLGGPEGPTHASVRVALVCAIATTDTKARKGVGDTSVLSTTFTLLDKIDMVSGKPVWGTTPLKARQRAASEPRGRAVCGRAVRGLPRSRTPRSRSTSRA